MHKNESMLLTVTAAIFNSKHANTDITKVRFTTNTRVYPGRTFVGGKLRGFDFSFNNNGTIVPVRVLEQNPDKLDRSGNLSKFAILARNGVNIAWVIRTDTNTFLGRVENGRWIKNEPLAMQNVRPGFVDGTQYSTGPAVAQDQYGTEYLAYNNRSFEPINSEELAIAAFMEMEDE